MSAEPGRERRPVALALVLIGAGLLWALHLLGVELRWGIVLPAAVVVVGLLVVATGRSPATAGLLPLGVVLAVVAAGSTLVPVLPAPSIGDRDHVVTDVADLQDRYRLGLGDLTLDLREVDLPPGTTTVHLDVGLGQLTVRVPPDATVVVDGRVGLGDLDVLGTGSEGFGNHRRVTRRGDPNGGRLELEATVGLGDLEVFG